MKYQDALHYVDGCRGYGIVPGLANMTEMLGRLGNPQDELKFVHIAGTNGKGSVLNFISTVLTEAGYRTGRYLSPAVREYRECFQINGKRISKPELGALMEQVKDTAEEMVLNGMPHPTPFELETALAFLYFRHKKCDIVVLETGMGGTLDATNVIRTGVLSVITSISMDHKNFLGNTLEDIAEQKAGILKTGVPAVAVLQPETVMQVLTDSCAEKGCTLITAEPALVSGCRHTMEKQSFSYKKWKNIELTMLGTFQIENCVLALEALQVLTEKGFPVTEQILRKGLLQAAWPGRLTLVARRPYFYVDGAHNEVAAEKLADTVRLYFAGKKLIFIIGVLKDKEYQKIAAVTAGLAQHVITVTPPGNERALPAYELAQAVAPYQPLVTAADSLEEAVELAMLMADKDTVTLAFGSLSYLGALMDIIENRHLIRSDTHGR